MLESGVLHMLPRQLCPHTVRVVTDVFEEEILALWNLLVLDIVKKERAPGRVLHVLVEIRVVTPTRLVLVRLVIEEGSDGDQDLGAGCQ